MIYLVIGPPASGKGTQAKRLAERLGIDCVSIGAAFRQLAATHPELGEQMAAGKLLDDRYLVEILKSLAADHSDNFIIDGTPRTAAQVPIIKSIWPEADFIVIEITLDPETIRQRAVHRIATPSEENRADDTMATVNQRIEIYQTDQPEVDRQLEINNVKKIVIDGKPDRDTIANVIWKKLHDH